MRTGVDVFRLNFSHGDHATHEESLLAIRNIAREMEIPVAVLQDLSGPKIRLGEFRDGSAVLESGRKFELYSEDITGTADGVSVSYPGLWKDVKQNQRILLADGMLELKVLETEPGKVTTKIIDGGEISDHKGLNLPETELSLPALSEKDRADLKWGIEHQVDYVAMSFVRSAEDLVPAREAMEEAKVSIPLIAKIEKPEAVDNLDEIIASADGVMIARGDLGVEMAPEKVPGLQKQIISKANQNDVLVITATQMLESMIHNPRPTRAEASDVANAIYDGTDAIMLSGETAVGEYPIQAAEMMQKIASESERQTVKFMKKKVSFATTTPSFSKVASHLAAQASEDMNVRPICAFTMSGFTARLLSKYRPETPVFALTPDERVFNQLALVWGVVPIRVPEVETFEDILRSVNEVFREKLGFKPGDVVVVVCGLPVPVRGTTNTVRLHVLE